MNDLDDLLNDTELIKTKKPDQPKPSKLQNQVIDIDDVLDEFDKSQSPVHKLSPDTSDELNRVISKYETLLAKDD